MFLKCKTDASEWFLKQIGDDINWSYRYYTHAEFQAADDSDEATHPTYIEFHDWDQDPGLEPPANGHRTLCLEFTEGTEWNSMWTTMECYLLNNDGKTIENLSP